MSSKLLPKSLPNFTRRPLLLRASSVHVADAFSKVPHPHGSSISADAFRRGVVKSGTDYSVYTAANLEGFDLAFYRRRSFYHTKDDSIPSLHGKASLWNMMESTLFATRALADDEARGGKGIPVYFDCKCSSVAMTRADLQSCNSIRRIFVGGLADNVLHRQHCVADRWPSSGCWAGLLGSQKGKALLVCQMLGPSASCDYCYRDTHLRSWVPVQPCQSICKLSF